jgi:hypothetical protein
MVEFYLYGNLIELKRVNCKSEGIIYKLGGDKCNWSYQRSRYHKADGVMTNPSLQTLIVIHYYRMNLWGHKKPSR